MKESLNRLSKILYLLGFVTLFLPAFVVPSCSSTTNPADTVGIDSGSEIKDTAFIPPTNTVTPAIQSEQEPSPVPSVLLPDGENFSFWAYLLFSLDYALIWTFVITLFWSGTLRFLNKHNKQIAVMSAIGLICLVWYLYAGDTVVWGFWWTLGTATLITVTNSIAFFHKNFIQKEV